MANEALIADAIRTGVEAGTADLRARIQALEQRQASVGVKYAGVWQRDATYTTGDLVSKGGGLWLALADTSTSPGGHPESWRLVVKSGGAER